MNISLYRSKIRKTPSRRRSNKSKPKVTRRPVKRKTRRRIVQSHAGPGPWLHVNENYSRRFIGGPNPWQFQCTLCLNVGLEKYCTRTGDMKRHLKSKKHSKNSFACTTYLGCSSTFTREDALKRHIRTIHKPL